PAADSCKSYCLCSFRRHSPRASRSAPSALRVSRPITARKPVSCPGFGHVVLSIHPAGGPIGTASSETCAYPCKDDLERRTRREVEAGANPSAAAAIVREKLNPRPSRVKQNQ